MVDPLYQSKPHNAAENPKLSDKHHQILEVESAISPDVIAESGARTVEHPRELPKVFGERQRRRTPGILFPVHRPNGLVSWCFRPDRMDLDRPGHKYEQPCKALGGSGNALSILPSQRRLIGNVGTPLVFVEGAKKQLSLITAFRRADVEALVVAISGVWNFLHRPDGKNSEPIPDLLDVPLEDRRATIMFDSDMLRNVDVQDAARRLAEHLQSNGASVHMTFFEDLPDGSKCGADDFFASGGTVSQLRLLTRAYDPQDFKLVRLSRDEKLRAMLEDLRRTYNAMPAAKIGECSDRATMRQLIARAEESGKVADGGIVVRAPSRRLAEHAHMSQQAQVKSLRRLAEHGYIERIEEPKRKIEEKGTAYLLKVSTSGSRSALRCHNGTKQDQQDSTQEQSTQERTRRNAHRYADSYAGDNATRSVPELRHSKVVHEWARREGRFVVVDSTYVFRLAKPRQEVVMYLLEHGGEAHEEELLERFGSKSTRLRDFRKRRIAPLVGYRYSRDKETGREVRLEIGPPLVACEGGMVSLLPEWREALEEHRKQTGELEDNERQRRRHRKQSAAYRNRDRTPTGKEGDLRGKDEVTRIVAKRREEERQHWLEEQRRKVGTTAATFLADELEGITAVRFKDALYRWRRRGGGGGEDLRRAVTYGPFRFKREEDGDLYVYHEDGASRSASRSAGPNDRIFRDRQNERKAKAEPKKLPTKVNGGYKHGPVCDCYLCSEPAAPKHVVVRF